MNDPVRVLPRSANRVPPHNLEAEESLLGAMMLSTNAIADAVQMVQPGDFYKPAHGHIFEAITALYAAGTGVDTVTVCAALESAQLLDAIGGAATVVTIQARTPAVSNAAHYAQIIEEASLLRRLITTAGEIAEMGFGPTKDAKEIVDRAESLVFEIGQHRHADSMLAAHDLLEPMLSRLEALYSDKRAITGVASGYHDYDHLLSGLQPNALIVVGARPAMGKTAFALGAAVHAAVRERRPVIYFSLEMGHIELMQRVFSSEGRIDATHLRNGSLTEKDWDRVMKSLNTLDDAPLWIDDNPNTTVMDIRAKARRLKSKQGDLGLIVVDYLQLMNGRTNAESRQVEISEMSRGLKILARELECPVMALSQLSRTLESRSDRRPMLSDLRESGAIEQDADVVTFLYRDEVYNPDSPDKGTAEVIVSKHRNGATGMSRLAFIDYCTRFDNMPKGRSAQAAEFG
jgi:replicative DNA helicase